MLLDDGRLTQKLNVVLTRRKRGLLVSDDLAIEGAVYFVSGLVKTCLHLNVGVPF